LISHWVSYDSKEPFVPNLDKFGFVYLITNTKTTKAYVGCKQYFSMGKKKRKHKWEIYTGSSKYLNEDIKKIGKEHFTFEVIAEYKNKRSLRYYEAYYQMKWDVLTAVIEGTDEPAFYNSYVGGKFYRPVESYTSEFNKGCRERNLGEKNPMFGKKRSDEDRKKIKNSLKKYYKNNPAKKGKDSPAYGTKHSDEVKKKISEGVKLYFKKRKEVQNVSKRSNVQHSTS
jgi:group I intron endonuclease